eukprot:gene48468-65021_t
MGQFKKTEVYDAILRSAKALFSENGYVQTSLPRIAAGAGISTANVYVYFKSKVEILYAIYDPWLRARLAQLAAEAQDILDHLSAELPEVTDWSGTVGVGVAANNAEYFDEPGMTLMLCALPSDQYRVFSGVAPLGNSEMSGFEAHTALVHADPATPDLTELIAEMAGRTDTGYLF